MVAVVVVEDRSLAAVAANATTAPLGQDEIENHFLSLWIKRGPEHKEMLAGRLLVRFLSFWSRSCFRRRFCRPCPSICLPLPRAFHHLCMSLVG